MGRRAFTLLELVMVVAILAIVAAVVLPNVSAVTGGARSATALRSLVQMGRYARSMALLNQTPVDLVLDLDGRHLSVEPAEKSVAAPEAGGEPGDGVSASTTADAAFYESGASATVSFGRALSNRDRDATTGRILQRARKDIGENAADVSSDTSEGLADAIHMERDLPDAVVAFLGYADTVEKRALQDIHIAGGGETNGVHRIRYRANGTCRPYRIAVGAEDDDSRAVVTVDAVGTPRVLRRTMSSQDERREKARRW